VLRLKTVGSGQWAVGSGQWAVGSMEKDRANYGLKKNEILKIRKAGKDSK
jgi:hypothetical protein